MADEFDPFDVDNLRLSPETAAELVKARGEREARKRGMPTTKAKAKVPGITFVMFPKIWWEGLAAARRRQYIPGGPVFDVRGCPVKALSIGPGGCQIVELHAEKVGRGPRRQGDRTANDARGRPGFSRRAPEEVLYRCGIRLLSATATRLIGPGGVAATLKGLKGFCLLAYWGPTHIDPIANN